jgi:hypothetical protein
MPDYAKIMKNDPELVQKIGNGNNQYTKQYGKAKKPHATGVHVQGLLQLKNHGTVTRKPK